MLSACFGPMTFTFISAFTSGFDLLITVTVHFPGACPVIRPSSLTVAMFSSELIHISPLLSALFGDIVTIEMSLFPTGIVTSFLLSFILRTFLGSVTVTLISPFTLGLLTLCTVTVQTPSDIADIQPSKLTSAILVSELVHFSDLSSAVAGSIVTIEMSPSPTFRFISDLLRVMDATFLGSDVIVAVVVAAAEVVVEVVVEVLVAVVEAADVEDVG